MRTTPITASLWMLNGCAAGVTEGPSSRGPPSVARGLPVFPYLPHEELSRWHKTAVMSG